MMCPLSSTQVKTEGAKKSGEGEKRLCCLMPNEMGGGDNNGGRQRQEVVPSAAQKKKKEIFRNLLPALHQPAVGLGENMWQNIYL